MIRFTKVLPLTISSTILFSMSVFEPLHAALLKVECHQILIFSYLYQLLKFGMTVGVH